MKIDWESGHGPFTAPLSAAGSALAASYAANAAGAAPWWGAVVAGAGLAGSHIAGRLSGARRGSLVLRAAAWVGAGSWCSWALVDGPWRMNCVAALAAGAVGLGSAMAGTRAVQRRADKRDADEAAAAERSAGLMRHRQLAAEWSARFSRVSNIAGVQVVGVEMWDHDSGYTLEGRFPEGGYTWRDMQRCQDGLAGDARLPTGCTIEIVEGVDRGSFLANVETVNQTAGEPRMYPDDYSPTSYSEPMLWGVHRDGSDAGAVCRELCAIASARRGSGKTNLMHVWIAAQQRAVDVLSWVIDLNGGGVALPWLRAWAALGRPHRPPIDWVADTPEKVLAMAEALLRIAKARKPGYASLMIEHDDDKLPVSPEVPAIVVNLDEAAELYSVKARRDPILKRAGDALLQVVELARAVACNVMATALRATQDVLTEPQLVVQSGLKVAMQADDRELQYLMGWGDKIGPQDMPTPGTGAYKVLERPARPFQAFRMVPSLIGPIVAATCERRPVLDELSVAAAGDAYARRWEDTEHLFDDRAPQPAPAAPTAVDEQQRPAREGWTDPTASWGKPDPDVPSADEALAEADETLRRVRGHIDDAASRGSDRDLDAEARAIFEANGLAYTPPAALDGEQPADGDPRRQIVFEIVLKSGPAGIGPEAIRDVFARLHPDVEVPHAATIGRWLGADPRVHRPSYGRYAVRPSNGDTPQ